MNGAAGFEMRGESAALFLAGCDLGVNRWISPHRAGAGDARL